MCDVERKGWRVSVEKGWVLLERWETANYYGGPRWVVRAEIPLDDAVEITRTLMRERKHGIAHEAVAAMEAG